MNHCTRGTTAAPRGPLLTPGRTIRVCLGTDMSGARTTERMIAVT